MPAGVFMSPRTRVWSIPAFTRCSRFIRSSGAGPHEPSRQVNQCSYLYHDVSYPPDGHTHVYPLSAVVGVIQTTAHRLGESCGVLQEPRIATPPLVNSQQIASIIAKHNNRATSWQHPALTLVFRCGRTSVLCRLRLPRSCFRSFICAGVRVYGSWRVAARAPKGHSTCVVRNPTPTSAVWATPD